MNSSLLACYLMVVLSSLAVISAADKCGGWEVENCDTKRAGEDGKSCQFKKPKEVCLKEGEWMDMDGVEGLTQSKYNAIGCKTGGKGIVTAASDKTTFKSNVSFNNLKTVRNDPDKSCAAWKGSNSDEAKVANVANGSKVADAVAALTKEIRAACTSPEDKLGSSTCKDVSVAADNLAKVMS